jgi:hypothetical protein
MPSDTTKPDAVQPETATCLFEDWFDPIGSGLRERVRSFWTTPVLTGQAA